jgi:ABC-type Fe3+ transport system substrate-binding protein
MPRIACLMRGAAYSKLSLLFAWLFLLVMWELGSESRPLGAGEPRPSGKIEWENTLEAAKKEGQITLYGSRGYDLIVDEGVFQKAYREIKVVTVSSETSVYLQRILAERRAGKYLADLSIAGGDSLTTLHESKFLQPITPAFLLPEVVDESKWWKKKHYYIDAERKYVFQYIGSPLLGSIYYNTGLVNPKEFNSFWDFLDPKWRGKIEVGDVRIGGSGNAIIRFFYYNQKLGPEFIKRLLSDMDVTIFRDARQSVDWLAGGKFAICFFCVSSQIGRAKKQGLPIETFGRLLKEGAGLGAQSGTVGFMKDAPHPNAAKVFLNWLLSKEGQLTMQTAYVKAGVGASNSLRNDISKEMVPANQRLQEGVEYLEIELPETRDMRPIVAIFDTALREMESKRQKTH